ncbi:hypothetical protein [Bradyrhizobium sp. USDA 3364]
MTKQRATNISISTVSAAPLRAAVEIESGSVVTAFEIDEELAHRLCADLERFLTQVPHRTKATRVG